MRTGLVATWSLLAFIGGLGCSSPNGDTQGTNGLIDSNAAGGGNVDVPGAPVGGIEPTHRLARLSHFQWQNSVRDLLRLEQGPDLAGGFTPDPIVGFDTNASQLRVSSSLRQDYERAAEALALQVASDPTAIARLVPADAPADPVARARAFIESFGLRAYRRPLLPEEVEQYVGLFKQGPELAPELDPFAAGVMLTLRLFLQSPHFVYRTEFEMPGADGVIRLSDYEVAAKLALALTGTIPDDALLAAAAAGSLDPSGDRGAIAAEAQRLIDGPSGHLSAQHVHEQLLALSRYAQLNKDSEYYPEFTPETPTSMRRAVELFVGALYDQNGGVRDLLTSPAGFVDDKLAPIYGLSAQFSADFTAVDFTDRPRRGLLTQPGFLALYAGERQPDPIHRGVFISEQILCVELPPPAPNIPEFPEADPSQTNRERIEAFTGKGTCGEGCHSTMINPLGLAFEHYDALGRYRTEDAGKPVDASNTYVLDGQEVQYNNALELVELIGSSNAAHGCYAKHWLSYLNGRLAGPNDEPNVAALSARSLAENLSIKQIALSLVLEDAFLTRLPGTEAP